MKWNNRQPTWVKIILAENPLRETVSADGPISLEGMFEVGYSLIATSGTIGGSTADPPAHFFKRMQARTAMPVDPRTRFRREQETCPQPNNSQDRSLRFRPYAMRWLPIPRRQGRLAEGSSPHRRA